MQRHFAVILTFALLVGCSSAPSQEQIEATATPRLTEIAPPPVTIISLPTSVPPPTVTSKPTSTPQATATVKASATATITPTATAIQKPAATVTRKPTKPPTIAATKPPVVVMPTQTRQIQPTSTPRPSTATFTPAPQQNCDPSYPTVCIPPPPPDLDCGEIPYRRFTVLPPDPHDFDRDGNGIGCES
jgi:hypothetical protein